MVSFPGSLSGLASVSLSGLLLVLFLCLTLGSVSALLSESLLGCLASTGTCQQVLRHSLSWATLVLVDGYDV